MEKLAALQHTVLAHSRQLIILHIQRCSGGLHPARVLRPRWCIAHHFCAHFRSCFAGLRVCALGAMLASKRWSCHACVPLDLRRFVCGSKYPALCRLLSHAAVHVQLLN